MTSKSVHFERETKFSAPVGFDLPDLRDIADRTERLPDQFLDTRYFDTPDLRLWARQMTLRHRRGEVAGSGIWTMKLPESEQGATLERTELSWPGEPDVVPDEALNIVKGVVRRAVLGTVVELETTRRRWVLRDADGSTWGELVDDVVTVGGGPRDGMRFRQLEVEVQTDQPREARTVAAALRAAGAQFDHQAKLARALGSPDLPKWDSRRGRTSSKALLGELVCHSIGDGLDRILDHDYRLRLADDPAPRDVHQARVATRRLRSNLKTFGVVLDPVWLGHTRAELQWLGQALGRVRDCDVLASELDVDGENLRSDPEGQAELGAALRAQRDVAVVDLITVLSGNRYLNLLDRLHAAAEQPPFLARSAAKGLTRKGDAPARQVLPRLVGNEWRALRRKLRKLGDRPSDHELHRTRIRAKQLRYAADCAAPVIGKPARRTAGAAETLQTVLGELHDAVGAEDWLRHEAGVGSPREAFRAGQLTALQQRRQQELRQQWRATANRISKKRVQHWMR